jgi:hypothetical protein
LQCEVNSDCLSKQCDNNGQFICLSSTCDRCGQSFYCPRCPVGTACEHDAQCETEHCENGICCLSTCESCGLGEFCPKCSAGEWCEQDSQCASNKCSTVSSKCLGEFCDKQKCGGLCDPCNIGGACDSNEDCITGLKCDLDDSVCVPEHCLNGKWDSDETDVDCGGSECSAKCSFFSRCKTNSDCDENGICDLDSKRCIASTCVNEKLDKHEAGIDCGGGKESGCLPCQKVGMTCLSNADVDVALGLTCDANTIVPLHCLDGVINQNEMGIDCGGNSCKKKCGQGSDCRVNRDCESNDCFEGVCTPQSCYNLKRDFGESDMDCGGIVCRPCTIGSHCTLDQDCLSGMCSDFSSKCQPPECATHCGGPCDPCPDSSPCSSDSDCASAYCFGEGVISDIIGTSRFLFPEAARGVCLAETCRLGCGKGDCPGCAAGAHCLHQAECASGSCDELVGICHASTCFDSKMGEEESDIDCGGPVCPKCTRTLSACRTNSDCASQNCGMNFKCLPSSCSNKRLDEDETDIDCGGGVCNPCEHEGDACETSLRDCSSGMICSPIMHQCVPKSCFNGIRERNESDVDCGPNCLLLCSEGSTCELDNECSSNFCHEGKCAPEFCLNECGQDGCPNKCRDGDFCEDDTQCRTGSSCIDARCVNEIACKMDWKLLGASDPVGCGGLLCPRCGPHRLCNMRSDCNFDFLCNSKTRRCEFESCFDSQLSQGEICVDGGGLCRRRCSLDQDCKYDFDCEPSLSCVDGSCALEPRTAQHIVNTLPLFVIPIPTRVDVVFSTNTVNDLKWTRGIKQVENRASAFQNERENQVKLESTRWKQIRLPPLTLESLCNVTLGCILEEVLPSNSMLYSHVFYLIPPNSALNTSVPSWNRFLGFLLGSNSSATFEKGFEIIQLSLVDERSILTLAGNCIIQNDLVVEFGSQLILLPNTILSGSGSLIAFGEVFIHANVVLDIPTTVFFGKWHWI